VHRKGDPLLCTSAQWLDHRRTNWETTNSVTTRSTQLWVTRGLDRVEVDEVGAGEIVWLCGAEEVTIGDTLSAPELASPALPPLEIEEPTVSMFFLVNSSPLAGQDGQVITVRQLRERLEKELRTNVALRVEDSGRPDGMKVSGRGELHLAILIEEIRREGLELCVSRPEVITRRGEDGALLEPIEQLIVDIPQEYQGVVVGRLTRSKGEIISTTQTATGALRIEFGIPTRGLIGYRSEFLTETRGRGIMSARFIGYGPWRGDIIARSRGSMVSLESGDATAHQLENLQERGSLFISPMDRVYQGMIVGEHSRAGDMACNPTKKKNLTNHRKASKEIDTGLDVPRSLSLDAALAWIVDDELVEVTPTALRLRKTILNPAAQRLAERRAADRSAPIAVG
jgi:GTP-binding protein